MPETLVNPRKPPISAWASDRQSPGNGSNAFQPIRWIGLLSVSVLLAGCGRGPTGHDDEARAGASTSKPTLPLRVAAASDLQTALPAIIRKFNERHGLAVEPTFGASGQLAAQIRAGAPFDVFLAANLSYNQDLAREGFVRPDSVRIYANGTLVLAVRRESTAIVKQLHDLTRPEVKRIAIANPAFAPYGVAARQALERSGLWTALESKIVRAESVRQALQFVESGNADAGLVGHAIASAAAVTLILLDRGLYRPIEQSLAVVARPGPGARRDPESAERFCDFLVHDVAQAILGGFGFARPARSSPDSPSSPTSSRNVNMP